MAPVSTWYRQTAGGQRRLDMCRHIVRALLGVGIKGVAFRHQPIRAIVRDRDAHRIRILLDNQTGGRMSQENCDQPRIDTATLYTFDDFVRDVIETLVPDG